MWPRRSGVRVPSLRPAGNRSLSEITGFGKRVFWGCRYVEREVRGRLRKLGLVAASQGGRFVRGRTHVIRELKGEPAVSAVEQIECARRVLEEGREAL